jgi:hypothetical protein
MWWILAWPAFIALLLWYGLWSSDTTWSRVWRATKSGENLKRATQWAMLTNYQRREIAVEARLEKMGEVKSYFKIYREWQAFEAQRPWKDRSETERSAAMLCLVADLRKTAEWSTSSRSRREARAAMRRLGFK